MSVRERDPLSGYKTTGHEWNGIEELNAPPPRAVYFFLIATIVFSIVCWVLMPAWPLGATYTKGLLGLDQRASVERAVARARAERAALTEALERTPVEEALRDPALMAHARGAGPALFADNCAPCHGLAGRGGPGFPDLRDGDWLWGGAPETVEQTVRVGVNSGHGESRISQMPAFGRDNMLASEDVRAVVAYVRSLSTGEAAEDQGRGAEIFATACVSCHGERGEGSQALGAPDLTDDVWLYGGDWDAVFQSVWGGRRGEMPTWEGRLSAADRRTLVLYLLDGGEPGP